MEEIKINVYDILKTENSSFRILSISNGVASVIEMETSKINIRYFSTREMIENIQSSGWSISKHLPTTVVDEERLSPSVKEKYLLYKDTMFKVENIYGPAFIGISGKNPKPELDKIIEDSGLSRVTFWRVLRKYLQSGCNNSSLLPSRSLTSKSSKKNYNYKVRTGRASDGESQSTVILDEEVLGFFEEGLQEYKRGRFKSYKKTFEEVVLGRHYSIIEESDGKVVKRLLPPKERPTFRQFYYYCEKHISQEEKDKIKTSDKEQRNNLRLLLSDSLKDVYGPGDTAEIDAWEADVSLVKERNKNEQLCVSRPILYFMIDVWTRIILAVGISFDNNSMLGITNLLLNLADNKEKYCEKYGFPNVSSVVWPSNILPRKIRVDRGAEFRSDKLEKILNDLGIIRSLNPGATGSFKGIVEQSFHQFMNDKIDSLEGKGLITTRYDSNHHREACLTIDEFTQLVINFVIHHNQKHIDYYKLTRKMIDDGVEPVPYKLWLYGCKMMGAPRPIKNIHEYWWSLLSEAKGCRINREGITWKGLFYLNSNDQELLNEMYHQQNRKKPFAARYDPRDIGTLYYLKNGELLKAPLNPDKTANKGFENLTYKELEDYLQYKKLLSKEGKLANEDLSYSQRIIDSAILVNVQSDKYAVTDDIRVNREKAKQEASHSNTISKRLEDKNLQASVESKADGEKETNSPQPEQIEYDNNFDQFDFASALADFEND